MGDLRVDCDARTVTRDGVPLELPRLSFDVLEALIKAAPDALSTDDLMDRVWKNKVVSAATVTKRIALLREALGEDSADPAHIKSVRAYGYSLAVLPYQEESTLDPTTASGSSPGAPRVPRWLGWSLAALVVLAGIALTFFFSEPESRAPTEKSIAVLPFQALGDDAADREFADGLTEEIMHSLARTGSLRVAGRVSSFRYADSDEGPAAIGKALNVAHLLEGSVRRDGDDVRIVARLVDAREGIQRWSQSWERPLGDVIDVQREISERVAKELHVTLSGKGRDSGRGTDNAEAWALVLRAKSLMEYPYGSDLPKAQTLLEEAVRLDPDYAEAWAHLGAVHMRRTLWNEPTYELSLDESIGVTRDAIDRSQAADPGEGWSLIVLAGFKWVFEDDILLTAQLTEQAVQRQPWNLGILIFAADIARSLGDLEQARELASYVLEDDPLCSWCRISLLTTLLALEDYESLERESNLAMRLTPRVPDDRYLLFFLGRAQLLGGDPAEAAATFRQIAEDSDMHLTGLAMAIYTLGNELESARYQEMLVTQSPGHASMTSQIAAWKGDYERAFESLDRWVKQRAMRVILQTNYLNPAYKSLHSLPGWQQFLESIGRSPEQIGDIEFDALQYLETGDDRRP